MRLLSARVQRWRNFVDSTWVDLHSDVTCIVGKNESGKSAFLQALYRLNPAHTYNSGTTIEMDYPRWRLIRDQRVDNIAQLAFVSCRLALSSDEATELSGLLDIDLPPSTLLQAERLYDGSSRYSLYVDDRQIARDVTSKEPDLLTADDGHTPSLEDIIAAAKSNNRRSLAKQLQSLMELHGAPLPEPAREWASKQLPVFFYFGSYDMLAGRVDIQRLRSASPDKLNSDEATALSLLKMANITPEDLTQGQFELRKAQLEAASSDITRQVFQYWTQNKSLRTSFDIEQETVPQGNGQTTINKFLNIRLADHRHGDFTTNIDTRSSGFRWFFSFLAAFADFAGRTDVVVLLDEPGLSLHGRAQADFLHYVRQELAQHARVIYTTHSPFLVEPDHLDSVRLVEDNSSENLPEAGAVITDRVFSTDPDTLFPLQGALGYDLAQNLFVGGQPHLVVEGVSDMLYLLALSRHLQSLGRTALVDQVSVVPVGGMSKVPTFVALLGAHLDVSVLVDSTTRGMQRINEMVREGLLAQSRLVTVGQVIGSNEADIEDLFGAKCYVALFNEAFGTHLDPDALDGKGRIVGQIERCTGATFDHTAPAVVLSTKGVNWLDPDEESLERFEALFRLINGTVA